MIHYREYLKTRDTTAGKFQVRPYRTSDLPQLDIVEAECFGTDRYPRFLFTQFGEILGAGFFVACRAETLVGYVLAVQDTTDAHRGWIFSLGIRPAHRLSGAATQLMDEAECYLAKCGCSEVALTVDPRNGPARHLYDGRDYRRVAYLPHHFGPGEHRLMLVASLSAGPSAPDQASDGSQ